VLLSSNTANYLLQTNTPSICWLLAVLFFIPLAKIIMNKSIAAVKYRKFAKVVLRSEQSCELFKGHCMSLFNQISYPVNVLSLVIFAVI